MSETSSRLTCRVTWAIRGERSAIGYCSSKYTAVSASYTPNSSSLVSRVGACPQRTDVGTGHTCSTPLSCWRWRLSRTCCPFRQRGPSSTRVTAAPSWILFLDEGAGFARIPVAVKVIKGEHHNGRTLWCHQPVVCPMTQKAIPPKYMYACVPRKHVHGPLGVQNYGVSCETVLDGMLGNLQTWQLAPPNPARRRSRPR